MRVYGEAFLFINGWMDFLCLLLAARLGRRRFNAGKALISAGFGAVYGLVAWSAGARALRSVPVMVLVCFGMTFAVFGRGGPRLFPLVAGAGWMLSGLSDFVLRQGAAPASAIWINGGFAYFVLLLTRRIGKNCGGQYRLRIVFQGNTIFLPALRDTGNLLTDGITGLPVIVMPRNLAGPFVASGINVNDLGDLPTGWRLIRVKTAAGNKTLMCFTPDRIVIRQGKQTWRAEAVIAVSDFEESRALLPDSLFYEQREGTCHAVL